MMISVFDLKAHKCKPKQKTEVEILKECLLATQNAAIDLAKRNEELEKQLNLHKKAHHTAVSILREKAGEHG